MSWTSSRTTPAVVNMGNMNGAHSLVAGTAMRSPNEKPHTTVAKIRHEEPTATKFFKDVLALCHGKRELKRPARDLDVRLRLHLVR